VIVLSNAIRLLHPMAPFITEELFQLLKKRLGHLTISPGIDPYTLETIRAMQQEACAVAAYPTLISEKDLNPKINETFSLLEQVVYSIRNIRGEMKLSPGLRTNIHLIGSTEDPLIALIGENRHIISSLVPIKELFLDQQESISGLSGSAMVQNIKILLPLPPELQEKEKERLLKENERLSKQLEKTKLQLDNKEFRERAPAALIDKLETQVKQTENELAEIANQLNRLTVS
jgi:valyl-tRNA synthetase